MGAAIAFFRSWAYITLHRYYSFYASFDQVSLVRNNLHGRFFQSSLSSSLSTNVVHDEIPECLPPVGATLYPSFVALATLYGLFPSQQP